jgi:hypothetical protein
MIEAPGDWGEDRALTRSRHLMDGSLSLGGFRSGWTGRWQPWATKRHSRSKARLYDANSLSGAFASFKSSVSNPSVNQP